MKIKCGHCKDDFEVADPARPSGAKAVKQKVTCPECGEENEVMWPADIAAFPKRAQED